ncbi:MAG: bifunctional UDP-N-acetylglucosamine diphosphorylase/glucosamine-1-phosphate N-acetyltransferase GlmU [Succinivibrio sp.]
MSLEVVILAAGKGKRMYSNLPKVLHKVANKPMLQHVIETAALLSPKAIHVVLGHQAELVEQMIASLPDSLKNKIKVAIQKEQLGTGHAVACALPEIDRSSDVLVLYGDTPLTPADLLNEFVKSLEGNVLSVLSAVVPDPFGYGRIIRKKDGCLEKIVEEKDTDDEQKKVNEINTGIIVSTAEILSKYLPLIKNNNNQGEYYLTDLAGLLSSDGQKVNLYIAPDFEILSGINSTVQLASVERLYQRRAANKLLLSGVTLADPERFDLRGNLQTGKDVFIDINCIFEGDVTLGNNVVIGAGCVIKNTTIGDNSVISPYTVMENSQLKQRTTIGPFARLRPGNVLEDDVHVGNFVECKNAHLGLGTKAGHLSYLGDADIGRDVNIGAGTITCNYDGANKFRTEIGDDVFIGSDSQLVAPVSIKKGVTVAAGTTVTKHTVMEENDLVLSRAQTAVVKNYCRPRKIKK